MCIINKMTNMRDMTALEPEKEMTKGRLTTTILVGLLSSHLVETPNNSDNFLHNLTQWSQKRSLVKKAVLSKKLYNYYKSFLL